MLLYRYYTIHIWILIYSYFELEKKTLLFEFNARNNFAFSNSFSNMVSIINYGKLAFSPYRRSSTASSPLNSSAKNTSNANFYIKAFICRNCACACPILNNRTLYETTPENSQSKGHNRTREKLVWEREEQLVGVKNPYHCSVCVCVGNQKIDIKETRSVQYNGIHARASSTLVVRGTQHFIYALLYHQRGEKSGGMLAAQRTHVIIES